MKPGKVLHSHEVHEAYERARGQRTAPLFLTCEHASQRLPTGYEWMGSDERLVGTHWAYDLGARELTLELAQALSASAVLTRFSRLLVDPNRAEGHPELFRQQAEGQPVLLNRALTPTEQQQRIVAYYRPYHAAVDETLMAAAAPTLLSIHTFTPVYEGRVRNVELGVLFDRDERAAESLLDSLRKQYPAVAANEPWSGKVGLIYAAEHHAHKHGRFALELEVRQDLAQHPAFRAQLIGVLVRHFGGNGLGC